MRVWLTFLCFGSFFGCGEGEFSHLPQGQTVYTDSAVTPNPVDSQIVDERDFCTPIECGLHDGVNAHRDDIGLSPLSLVAHISEISRLHSEDMALGLVSFGHAGFLDRVQALSESYEIVSVAENVAANSGHDDPSSVALEKWLDSDGHRDNLEGQYSVTGVGVVEDDAGGYFFTQIYVLIKE